MKKNLKIASMIAATLLAFNSNANAGGPGSGKYLAIAALAGLVVIGGVAICTNWNDIKEFERNKCMTKVQHKKIGWRACCIGFPSMQGCTNDTNPPVGTETNPNPPRCDLFPNLPICNNDDPKRCDLFPNLPACTPVDTPNQGVSEPIGMLAALSALSLFLVARRRK